MSDLSEETASQRSRSARTGRKTRKDRHAARKRPSKPGGITLDCGCRWLYTGGAWLHVTPCRSCELHLEPAGDTEMRFLAWSGR